MPCSKRLAMLILLLLGLCLEAGPAWTPIPPTAWAIKAGGPEAPKGAVILQERLRLNARDMEWWFRVRIVSEAGKEAAEFSGFPDKPIELVGRTIYPDGKTVEFNSKKDFKTKTATTGSFQRKRTTVIPPGVTADCIVEIYYKDEVYWPTVSHWERRVMRAYPSQSMSLEMPSNFPLAWNLFGTGQYRPQMVQEPGERRVVFTDIPASDDGPYMLESALDQPCLVVFSIDPDLYRSATKGAEAYWKDLASSLYQEWYEGGISRGGRYKSFAKEVLAGLPARRREACSLIVERVRTRIRNLQQLSWEQQEQRKLGNLEIPPAVNPQDLGATVKSGETNDEGMLCLIFQLLRDAQLNPKLLFVCDRNLRLFNFWQKNRHQFTQVLIGVEDLGEEPLWVDPSLRFMPPGLVNQDFQGTFGLLVNPSDWSVSQYRVPTNLEHDNVQAYRYQATLVNEMLSFQMTVDFTGQPAFVKRMENYRTEPQERDRNLKEDFEKRLPSWTVTSASVQNTVEAAKPLTWTVSAHREWEEGGRMEFRPFPGMPNPYWLPDVWPDRRHARIILPYLKTHTAECRLILPKGYRIQPQAPLDERNLFGHVKWSVASREVAEGVEATVKLEVVSKVMAASPEDYGIFRGYMGWITEALGRSLVIEKGE